MIINQRWRHDNKDRVEELQRESSERKASYLGKPGTAPPPPTSFQREAQQWQGNTSQQRTEVTPRGQVPDKPTSKPRTIAPPPTSFQREAEQYANYGELSKPQLGQYSGLGRMNEESIIRTQAAKTDPAQGGWQSGRDPDAVAASKTRQRNEFGGRNWETQPMTWDEYEALSPRARAAVDANTAIADAVAMDYANRDTAVADADYNKRVEALFGKEGGGDYVAPETLRVLELLGVGTSGREQSGVKDLDNYLNLGQLASSDDIAFLNSGAEADPNNLRQRNAITLSERASKTISESLAAGQTLLQRAQGAEPSAAFNPLSEQNKALTSLFDFLARTDVEPATDDELGTWVAELGQQFPDLTPDTIKTYFDTRLDQADYAATALGQNGTYMSTAEFRKRYFGD